MQRKQKFLLKPLTFTNHHILSKKSIKYFKQKTMISPNPPRKSKVQSTHKIYQSTCFQNGLIKLEIPFVTPIFPLEKLSKRIIMWNYEKLLETRFLLLRSRSVFMGLDKFTALHLEHSVNSRNTYILLKWFEKSWNVLDMNKLAVRLHLLVYSDMQTNYE